MQVQEWSCDCAKKKYLERDIAVHLLQNENYVGLETSLTHKYECVAAPKSANIATWNIVCH